MTNKAVIRAVTDVLEDLRQIDFQKFVFQLRDRREDPRFAPNDVENKSAGDVVNLMFIKFTEPEALQVALDILRRINCIAHAERLDSRTKAFRDNGDPTFRKTSTGEVERCRSQDALRLANLQTSLPPKSPAQVEAEAKDRVLAECGDPQNNRLVLSRFTIQFGQYRGQTFQWLLENDIDYVAFLVAEKNKGHKMYPDNHVANKVSLNTYAKAYPEFFQVRCIHLAKNGQAHVGLRGYKNMKLKDLYDSQDPKVISYVEFLRGQQQPRVLGSSMHVAIEYILQRDKARAANQPTSNSTPQVPTKSPTKREWTPHTRSQFNQAASGSQNKRHKEDMKENCAPSP